MSLDWDLLREIHSWSDEPIWGNFPHPPLTRIAKRLGVTRYTLWQRLRQWTESGLLRGYEILPHPSLLGADFGASVVSIPNPLDKLRFLDELEYVDRVFLASWGVGSKVVVMYVTGRAGSQSRLRTSLSRLQGVASVGPTRAVRLPVCHLRVSTNDWELISALRKDPTGSLDSLAREVRSSAKTASRRLRALRRANAVLSFTVEDYSKFPGTVAGFVLGVSPGVDSRTVAKKVDATIPGLLEVPPLDMPPRFPANFLCYWQEVRSAAAIEETSVKALAIPGIDRVDSYFEGGDRSYRGWFDERISEAIAVSLARG